MRIPEANSEKAKPASGPDAIGGCRGSNCTYAAHHGSC